MFKKKKTRRRKLLDKLDNARNEMLSRENSTIKEIKGEGLHVKIGVQEIEEVQEVQKVREAQKVQEVQKVKKVQQVREAQEVDDELKIREVKIADSLLMQLEDEVIGFINRRLEEHVTKRIKGVLLPVAKLYLKTQKLRKKCTGDQTRYFLDLEDDLEYILENSKLRRISPQVGEKFNPVLHEEVDFSWNPDRSESEILSAVRDGFFWEYNQEMIIKPQVVVNRRVSV